MKLHLQPTGQLVHVMVDELEDDVGVPLVWAVVGVALVHPD
jgi:hypothetical protein